MLFSKEGAQTYRILALVADCGNLDRIQFQDLNAGEPHGIIENDTVDENGDLVHFGYLLDSPCIHRFYNVRQIFKP